MTEVAPAENGTPIEDYRKSLFENYFSLRKFLRDRNRIGSDPRVLRNWRANLESQPYQFATFGLLVPATILGVVMGFVAFFVTLPATGIDRQIKSQQQVVAALENFKTSVGKRKPEPEYLRRLSYAQSKALEDQLLRAYSAIPKTGSTPEQEVKRNRLIGRWLEVAGVNLNRSMSDLAESTTPAKVESETNKLKLLKLNKILGLLFSWKLIIIGGMLVLSAYLFNGLCKRIRPPLPDEGVAAEAYLFSLGSTLFLPAIGVTLTFTVSSLADRFEIYWLTLLSSVAAYICVMWGFYGAARAGEWLQLTLDGQQGVSISRVGWRFMAALFAVLISAVVLFDLTVQGAVHYFPDALVSSR